jgi:NarL family two-component system response regulator LiaR
VTQGDRETRGVPPGAATRGSAASAEQAAPLRMVIADGDPMARHVVVERLQADGDIVVVGEASDGPEAVELTRTLEPDVLLTESSLRRLDGLGVMRGVAEAAPDVRVVFFSTAADDSLQLQALRAGACGFLSKEVELDGLARALRAVGRGEAAISRRATLRVIESLRTIPPDGVGLRPIKSPLTTREWEVLELLTEGASTHDVANTLVLSVETVYSHIKSIMRKLGVHSRAAAIAEAKRIKLGPVAAA